MMKAIDIIRGRRGVDDNIIREGEDEENNNDTPTTGEEVIQTRRASSTRYSGGHSNCAGQRAYMARP